MTSDLDAVTGAFSFTGGFIARHLLAGGRRVRTLTNHPHRPGAEALDVEVAPLQFDDLDALIESLRGVDVFYNTYWIRFPHSGLGFADAIENTRLLVGAAKAAGVRKVVHISVSNPSLDSPLHYYAGKARTEAVVREGGLPWAVVRPTLIFGPGDVLINNIAWLLRRAPVFFIPGNGAYRLQPVAGDDVADIAIWAADQPENVTVDAAGPDTLSYADLVDNVAIAIHHTRRIVFTPPAWTVLAGRVLGRFVKDVILTPQELAGLMDELLVSHEPPRGRARLDDWLLTSADDLGKHYASELDRHFRR
ncbi:MAG TPA: NmrA family NAD(P)-binding protein [Candidatus Dormibacteraeota bacterium]|nr:NmrA family NAD(P)-binding protein [Candidatus Dormibacteraeota bacterium]